MGKKVQRHKLEGFIDSFMGYMQSLGLSASTRIFRRFP